MQLEDLHARGFDRSVRDAGRRLIVRCSQCEALVINGVPAHEAGCPNALHECKGCSSLVPRRVTYCEDCRQ
jgi:hypothetical protein